MINASYQSRKPFKNRYPAKLGLMYSLTAIAALYLRYLYEQNHSLEMDVEDLAASTYHAFILVTNFVPMFGAYMADTCLGKFKTTIYMSFVTIIGIVVLAFSAIPSGNNRIQDLPAL